MIHPSALFGEAMVNALTNNDLPGSRHVSTLDGALSELSRQPALLALAGLEAAPNGVGEYVRTLLEAGSESVVVIAPEVREQDLIAALEAGTLGYVGRSDTMDRLVFDLKGALRGEACLPRTHLAPVLRLLIERRRRQDVRVERLGRLSKREREVLRHLAAGAANEDIATTLFLSPATVRTHVQNILGKLEVHSRLEAVSLALDEEQMGPPAQNIRTGGITR